MIKIYCFSNLMKIKTLALQNFKNYENLALEFSEGIQLFLGQNGMGKTNLLDALHYLTFTKTAFVNTDNQNIRKGALYFLVKGNFENAGKYHEVICYHEVRKKKVIKLNGSPYERIIEHIGRLPLVLSTPYDSDLIRETSEVRRKWIDGCIAQYNQEYLADLMGYNRILSQRNTLLKSMEGHLNGSNSSLLDTYDTQIITLSKSLSQVRADFVNKFIPFLSANEGLIVFERETCSMTYQSQVLAVDFERTFLESRKKDLVTQRSNVGLHKDDYSFLMDGQPLKKFGSQGQQKSFLIALRLSQYDYLAKATKTKPMLLLDDVFDKLDDERIERLTDLLSDSVRFGQVFITDARKERTSLLLKDKYNAKIFEIGNGKVNSYET
ncbi:MAG: DNA replication and repair protein RecF [Flammeovirgaceae bacterium]|nr:DNA replication and repair protein RecF [Flammeovirgaceae bacterium]